jgi:hypothetical protein
MQKMMKQMGKGGHGGVQKRMSRMPFNMR